MVHHVLPEVEPFSERAGGALSRWTANLLRHDDARIICPSADRTWGFAMERIQVRRGMQIYGRVLRKREYRIRTALRVPVVEWLLRGVVSQLQDEDILYIHNRPEYVLALHSRTAKRFKVVLHMHNDHLRNLTAAERASLHPDLIVFNSRFLENQGRKLVPGLGRSAVLHNGADEGYFHPAAKSFAPQVPVVLFVGRLILEKGAHVLIDAMRLLDAQGVNVRAKIIGGVHFNNNRRSEYVEELHRDCPANVDFLPYMAGMELAEEFRRSSIFCCPSIWEEPFGMVNVEAMASGLPVIASDVGGIPEIFSRGGGVLVPKGRAAELAHAIKALAEDEPERQRIAAQALTAFQQRFRWSVICEEYRVLIETLKGGAVLFPSARAS
jgi:spore coat protein SA